MQPKIYCERGLSGISLSGSQSEFHCLRKILQVARELELQANATPGFAVTGRAAQAKYGDALEITSGAIASGGPDEEITAFYPRDEGRLGHAVMAVASRARVDAIMYGQTSSLEPYLSSIDSDFRGYLDMQLEDAAGITSVLVSQ